MRFTHDSIYRVETVKGDFVVMAVGIKPVMDSIGDCGINPVMDSIGDCGINPRFYCMEDKVVIEQWIELKKTITEMRDNGGTGTQHDVCKFLVSLMETLEIQKQEPKTKQRWKCKRWRRIK